MSNELVPKDILNNEISSEVFRDITAPRTDYFSRIQLFGGKSNPVQEGRIGANHYGAVIDGDIIDLGNSVDVYLVSVRAKALDTSSSPPVECFDKDDEVFSDIRNRSLTKDSGCMFGPEFLVYVPTLDKFLTLFMSSATAQREARKMFPMLRSAVTLKSKPVKNEKYVWTAPVVVECSTPLDVPQDDLEKRIQNFLNPPKKGEQELADGSTRER